MLLDGLLGLASSGGPAVSTSSSLAAPSTEERALAMRVDALELACAGLWRLLKEHHGYTDEQLVAWVDFVDQEDGVKDGKHRPKGANCPRCGRPALTRARGKCLWCGAETPRQAL